MNQQGKVYKFEVYGKLKVVERVKGRWQLFDVSKPGMRLPIYDVVIPDELEVGQVKEFLADIYHESASDKYPDVKLLN